MLLSRLTGLLFILLIGYTQSLPAQLVLVEISPKPYANQVDPASEVRFIFNEALARGTINAQNIVIRGENTGIISGDFSAINTQGFIFKPRQSFKAGELIFVDISNRIRGRSGTSFETGFHSEFRVKTQPSPNHPLFFRERIISLDTDQPESVFTADLNQDGYLDVLAASVFDNKVTWYANQNGRGFEEQEPLSTNALQARSVYPADLDNDGDLDVISASFLDNKIAWYQNLGDKQFEEQEPLSLEAEGAFSVYASDIDSDGDMDVLSASILDDKVAWYQNDGRGRFIEKTITTNTDRVWAVYASDLDRDGDVDILSASTNDNKIAWFENEGNETFTERVISTEALKARFVYAADLDGDGHQDVISASEEDNKVAWYQNNGDGTFSKELIISTNALGARYVHAADLDGDGDLDVVVAPRLGRQFLWYQNDGQGGFTEQAPISTNTESPTSIYASDLDNDGDLDLIASSQGDNQILWYENTLPPPLQLTDIQPSPNASRVARTASIRLSFEVDMLERSVNAQSILIYSENRGIISGSFDTEGKVITFTPEKPFEAGELIQVQISPELRAIAGNAFVNGYFFSFRTAVEKSEETPPLFQENIISTNAMAAFSVHTSDLDGDGDQDVISASFDDDKIAWYEQVENQEFIERVISNEADGALNIYPTDLDSDGDVDILAAASFSENNQLAWYENDGEKGFTRQIIPSSARGAFNVHAADLDGDGDQDILLASYRDARITWYENDGREIFTENLISDQVQGARAVYTADVDSDGDLDVLSASREDNRIVWFENTDQGFNEKTITNQAEGALSVYAADLDQDGDMDVLSASTFDNKIAWYENDGAQSFQVKIITEEALGARAVYVADVDGDGDLDVLSASDTDNKIAWYENNGEQVFKEKIISQDARLARAIYASDVDGDGDMDVLSASADDHKIAWYENIFKDDPPVVVNPLPDTTLTEDHPPLLINLRQVFNDPDNNNTAISKAIAGNSNPGLLTASVEGDFLRLTLTPDSSGTAQISVRGTSNGLAAQDMFTVNVLPVDDAPEVINPLSDVSVPVNTLTRRFSLANVFGDRDNVNENIEKSVANQPAGRLLAALIRNDSLVLNFQPDVSGTTEVVVQGRSQGKTVNDTLRASIRLPAPFNLSANAISDREIELRWEYNDNFPEARFRVERALSPDFQNPVSAANLEGRQYLDIVNQDTLYFYRVRADLGSSNSAFSNVSAARPVNVPTAPLGLQATLLDSAQVRLTWSSSGEGVAGFRVERASLLSNNNFTEIVTLGPAARELIDRNLQENLSYRYRVRAFNTLGNSSYSNIDQVQLPPDQTVAPPTPPLNLTAQALTTRQINLSWQYDLDTTTLFIVERLRASGFIEGQQDTLVVIRNDQQQRLKKFTDVQEIVPDAIYTYRVIALHVGGNTPSNIAITRAVCGLRDLIAVVSLENSDGRICEGKSLPLEIVPLLEEANYQWLRNGVPIPRANSRRYLAEQTGSYSCIVQVDVCTDTTFINKDIVFDGSPPELNIRLEEGVFRTNQRDASSYQWFRNFEPIQGANQRFYTPELNGQYYLIAAFGIGPAACESISNTLNFPPTVTSLEDGDISALMQITPNPSQEVASFRLKLSHTGKYELSITDLRGQILKQLTGWKKEQELIHTLNLSELPSGAYVLTCKMAQMQGQRILVKY